MSKISSAAFPMPASIDHSQGDYVDGNRQIKEQEGMTYREWLIGQAMAQAANGTDPKAVAIYVIECADEIIKALNE